MKKRALETPNHGDFVENESGQREKIFFFSQDADNDSP